MVNRRKESLVLLFGCSLIFVTGTLYAEQHASSEPVKAHTQQVAAESIQLQKKGGLRAFIDPSTGELISAPPVQTRALMFLTRDEENNLSRSHEGLEAVIQPDGSIMVDLKGRFRSSIYATVNASGEVSTTHDAKHAGFSNSTMVQPVNAQQLE